jgi:hypothetical protein
MGNLISLKTAKQNLGALTLNQLRIDITVQLQKYKEEYSSRNDTIMADFFDKIDLEFNQKFIENSKNKSSSTVQVNKDTNL